MTAERKAAWILAGIAASEGTWVAVQFLHSGPRFLRYLGFAGGARGAAAGWIAAAAVTALFVAASVRLPAVREHLVRPSALKLLALAVAVMAGILEEVMFRKWIIDAIAHRGGGVPLQIVVSAIAFGVAHGVWGLFGGSARAAGGATLATSLLGGALAVVYVVGGRSLAPCVAAHFALDALVEPGLALAAARGEMGRVSARRSALSPEEQSP